MSLNLLSNATRCVHPAMLAFLFATAAFAQTGDMDEDGYIGRMDLPGFLSCLAGPSEFCAESAYADLDEDQDVDLADYAHWMTGFGHLPIPLRDTLGNILSVGSTVPYSGRQTCGGCHDVNHISNGFKFQQGRTDTAGNIIMKDEYHNDGRWWHRSAGRFGACSPAGSWRIMAGKENPNESEMDLTAFRWVGECAACHPGGGPGEFDRDGLRLFNAATGQFGYELLGKTAAEVVLDGDYAYMDPQGNRSAARWDITGLSEPDCLHCHVSDPSWSSGANANRYNRRAAAAAAKADLVDNSGQPVAAYASAGVAGQGWFSSMPVSGGKATKLQIDYNVGIAAGTLEALPNTIVALTENSLDYPPKDNACWQCHGSIGWMSLRGGVWFDERDFHFAKLNNMLDDDPGNDVPAGKSTACVYCHPGNIDHNIAKGNSFVQHSRDELDWVGLRTCRSCHLEESPTRHPDAPPVPGSAIVHLMGRMMDVLSCQACHIPTNYVSNSQIRAFRDTTLGSGFVNYNADFFYSSDPVDPQNPDKSTWHPGLYFKEDEDGVMRLFPAAPNLQAYWGEWDQRGTPNDFTDDVIMPIIAWRIQDVLNGQPLSTLTDDNGDGRLEINRPAEVLDYIQALRGNDKYGRQVAANPVLVRGWRVWHEDTGAPDGVASFDPAVYGIKTDVELAIWGLNHNPRRANEAWGAELSNPAGGCRDCHRPDTLDSPVFDRLMLVDPFGPDGQPVYQTIRAMTGLNPP